ncbi:MAG: hypothetical protein HN350_10790 [Phycisphaerales bacterium]|jgi:hypothetical protein|nr:hypothetical protein [Phycisphaerales bacterium]
MNRTCKIASVLAMLVALVSFGCNGGPEAQGPPPTRAEAIARIRELGGIMDPEPSIPEEKFQSVDFSGCPVVDADVRFLAVLTELRGINLSDTDITNSGLKHLVSLKKLRGLSLENTSATVEGLLYLKGLPHLSDIDVKGTSIRESDLAKLGVMKSLRMIRPFFDQFRKIWLVGEDLRATEWTTSKDGMLSIRLLGPARELGISESIMILVEMRNNTDKPLDVLRPLGDRFVSRFSMTGPGGPVGGVRALPIYILGSGAFFTLQAREVIRDRRDLAIGAFRSNAPGQYKTVFRYRASPRHHSTAAKERYGKKNIWVGEIQSEALTIIKSIHEGPVKVTTGMFTGR